ncbi:hypothetical protein T281_14735 [Rhodomicrobium udaipurense JA643]|nr:hypothetical protein T281_14735 [Rhodomicrobium udaipurense JA643]
MVEISPLTVEIDAMPVAATPAPVMATLPVVVIGLMPSLTWVVASKPLPLTVAVLVVVLVTGLATPPTYVVVIAVCVALASDPSTATDVVVKVSVPSAGEAETGAAPLKVRPVAPPVRFPLASVISGPGVTPSTVTVCANAEPLESAMMLTPPRSAAKALFACIRKFPFFAPWKASMCNAKDAIQT